MTHVRFVGLLLFLALSAATAQAGEKHTIVAAVGDEIITSLDVEDRMKLVMETTGLRDQKDVHAKLMPQIVRSLVDERLQLQAAAQANITVTQADIDGAVALIEKQKGKAEGSLDAYLREHGVAVATFRKQVEAQIAWSKLLSRKVAPRVTVTNEEVIRRLEQQRRQQGAGDEVLLSSILFPVDRPENEDNVMKLAQKLVSEIRGGASFDAVATQLSQVSHPIRKQWLKLSELDPSLATAIRKTGTKGLMDPVRSAAGYHILEIYELRQSSAPEDAEALFKEIVLSLKNDAGIREVDVLMGIARQVAKYPGTCHEKGIAGIQDFADLNIGVSYVRTTFSGMSPELAPLVRELHVEQVSEPFASDDGIHLLMLCEKTSLPARHPEMTKIKNTVFQEKLELESLRYLRDLRREAFIEVRL